MPYIIILLIIMIIYVTPFEGIVPVSEDEKTIMEMYSTFETRDLNKMIDEGDEGLEGVLTSEDDFETMSVLGDLNSGDTALDVDNTSDKDYEDVDITKYLK